MLFDGIHPRALVGAPLSFTWVPQDQNGEPSTVAGTVTAVTTNAIGTVLSTTTLPTAPYTVTFAQGTISQTDTLTITWSVSGVVLATTRYDIVGAFYFTSADLRGREPSLADGQRDPLANVLAVRNEVETMFERVTKQCFVPRFRVQRIPADRAHNPVRLDRSPVRSVRYVNLWNSDGSLYYAFTTTDIAAIKRSDGFIVDLGRQVYGFMVEIGYECGHSAPPADLKRAAMTFARQGVNKPRNGLVEGATSYTTAEGQHVTLATPGVRQWHTGIPSVDEALMAYDLTGPMG